MLEFSTPELAWGAASFVLACMAGYERWRNSRSAVHAIAVAEAQKLLEIYKDQAAAWESRADYVRSQLDEYRKQTHDEKQDMQGKLLGLTEQVSKLQAKTDITPLLIRSEQQAEINMKMLSALDTILTHLKNIPSVCQNFHSVPSA